MCGVAVHPPRLRQTVIPMSNARDWLTMRRVQTRHGRYSDAIPAVLAAVNAEPLRESALTGPGPFRILFRSSSQAYMAHWRAAL